MTRNRTYLVVAFILTLAPFALAQKGKKKKHAPPPAATASSTAVDTTVPPATATATASATVGPTTNTATATTATPATGGANGTTEAPKEEEKKEDDQHRKATSLALMGSFVLPIGSHTDYTRTGFGINVDGEHRVSPTFRLSARTGFHYHLAAKDFEVVGTNAAVTTRKIHVIPVLIGVRYFPGETGWYVNAETGLFIRFFFKEYAVKNTGKILDDNSVKFNLGVGAGGGYQYDRVDLRASLHTYDVTHLGESFAFSLNFGYKFFEM